jgi:hypothetical protein
VPAKVAALTGAAVVDAMTSGVVAFAGAAARAAALDQAGAALAHEAVAAVDARAAIDAHAVCASLTGRASHVVASPDALPAHANLARGAFDANAGFLDTRSVDALVRVVAAELAGAAHRYAARVHTQLARRAQVALVGVTIAVVVEPVTSLVVRRARRTAVALALRVSAAGETGGADTGLTGVASLAGAGADQARE